MIDKLTGEFIESTCVNPTFIRPFSPTLLDVSTLTWYSGAPSDDEPVGQVPSIQEGPL
jgi:hypothetical protein